MRYHRITVEQSLYLLAFGLALLLRFLRLGVADLNDYEANLAIEAIKVFQGGRLIIETQPAYLFLTGILFFLFDSNNFLARFWQALAGSLLVWVPFISLNKINKLPFGKTATIILAFALAVDPGLVALSRQAGGPMLALGMGALAFSFWLAGYQVVAGIFTGMALLSGPPIIHGLLSGVITWGLYSLVKRYGRKLSSRWLTDDIQLIPLTGSFLLTCIATILVIGTFLMRYPSGLSALAQTIPDYLSGWVHAGDVPISRMMIALVVYQPLALLFAIVGAIKGWIKSQRLPVFLSLASIVIWIITIANPSREVSDLAWLIIPLWGLAACELANMYQVNAKERLIVFSHTATLVLLSIMTWSTLSGITFTGEQTSEMRLRWVLIGGLLVLGLVTTAFTALGWSARVAQRGLLWGITLSMALYTFSSTWGVSQVRPSGVSDLWNRQPAIHESDLLVSSLSDLSEWNSGNESNLDVIVLTSAPSLRWLLRDWQNVNYLDNIPSGALPDVIISSTDMPEPGLPVAYRGQDFALWSYTEWEEELPTNWPRWLVFRQISYQRRNVILWARGDLFRDSSIVPLNDLPSQEDEQPESPASGIIE